MRKKCDFLRSPQKNIFILQFVAYFIRSLGASLITSLNHEVSCEIYKLAYISLTKLYSTVREIEKLNRQELEAGVPIGASWHNDYNDTAYIFIGGLLPDLNEGDVLAIFSQYGVPVHVKLVRSKETGKSQGFGFLKYEDQRSTVLAVDNLNGVEILGRKLRVDHTYYKAQEDVEELKTEMAFDDYLDEVDKHVSNRRREQDESSSRRHHDRHGERNGKNGNRKKHSSSASLGKRHRDRSKSPRQSRAPKRTEDEIEKELEDPMASYFKERQKNKR